MAADRAVARSGQPTEGALWRDQRTLLTGAVLLAAAALAWVGVVRHAVEMQAVPMGGAGEPPMPGADSHPGMGMGAGGAAFAPGAALAFLGAWGVMMAAMMLPSATPMLALYGTVSRSLARSGTPVAPTALVAALYLLVWVAFGVPVDAAGVLVAALAAGSAAVAHALPYALAVVLVAAGAYQFTALKRACLRACQGPLAFLLARWRSGYAGALRLGLAHARYCVGCCWGLMAVLVAAGAMGLHRVLLIAAVVAAEKVLPRGAGTARAVGAALVALGLAVLVRPGLALALRGGPPAM